MRCGFGQGPMPFDRERIWGMGYRYVRDMLAQRSGNRADNLLVESRVEMPGRRKGRGQEDQGFTVAELLIVVAIIAVLVGVAIPAFGSQLEKSREAADAANIRSAYAQVRTAMISDDQSAASGWSEAGRHWELKVDLLQKARGWESSQLEATLDSLCTNGKQSGSPAPGGRATVRCNATGEATISYGGHIDTETAQVFLTRDILESILERDSSGNPSKYPHSVVDSEEYHKGFGTERFKAAMEAAGFDLAEHGAASWTIYAKGPDGKYLEKPAIYYTLDKVSQDVSSVGKRVAVIGYRDGKYDVHIATVKRYDGDGAPYNGLERLSPAAVAQGGTATFQYDSWEEAERAYNYVRDKVAQGSNKRADDLLKEGGFKV